MGANNSTRRVSFESDENDNITVVKGIRLSENVIKRMREPEAPVKPHTPPRIPSPPLMADPAPLFLPISPPFDPITSLPPPPAPVEPMAPPPPPPSVTENVAPTPPPPSMMEQPPVEAFAPPPPPPPAPEPETAAGLPPPPAAPMVDEEELRRKITEDLQKGLDQERSKAEHELQTWLQEEEAQAQAFAQAQAQEQVSDEVSRILAVERATAQESLQQAVLRERLTTEDEKLRAQLYAKQLEARDAELKKQDAFYREQVAKLEERSAQFYKVTTENYHKAADQVNAKFRRYEISPVCANLQGQILKCYRENTGKTLHCSNIASLYLQCVNNAKQNKLRTGG